jgi:hypothetical protein
MAKKKETPTTEVAVAAPQAVEVKTASLLPSLAGASPEVIERMQEVQDNLESVESFRLPRTKMTAAGFELIEGEPVVTELEGVLIHTKKTNVYYGKPYNPNDVGPPDCFSLDGNTPDKSIEKPVSKTCKGCPMAEFGTNSMKSGKACRNLKPIYLLLSDEAIMPRQLTVAPSSLKAANQYLMDLTERGIAYRKVKTKITAYKENAHDTYMKLKFSMGQKLDEQQVKNVEFLRNQWRPVMDAQIVDHRESAPDAQPAAPQGEY